MYQGSGPSTDGSYNYYNAAPSQGYHHGHGYHQYYSTGPQGYPGVPQPGFPIMGGQSPCGAIMQPQGVPLPYQYAANVGDHAAMGQWGLPSIAQSYNQRQPYQHRGDSHGQASVDSTCSSSHSKAGDADIKQEKGYSKSSDRQCSSSSRDTDIKQEKGYSKSSDRQCSSSSCDTDIKQEKGYSKSSDRQCSSSSRDTDIKQEKGYSKSSDKQYSSNSHDDRKSFRGGHPHEDRVSSRDSHSNIGDGKKSAKQKIEAGELAKQLLKRKTGEDGVDVESKVSSDSFSNLSALEKTLHLLHGKTSAEDDIRGSEKGSRGGEKPSMKPAGALGQLESYNDSGDDNEHAEKYTKMQTTTKKNAPSTQPFWSVDAVPTGKENGKGSELPDIQEQMYEQWRKSINLSSNVRVAASKEHDVSRVNQLSQQIGQTHNLASSSEAKKAGDNGEEELDSTVQNILQSIGFSFDLSKTMEELTRQKKRQDVLHTGMINQSASFLEQSERLVQDVRAALFSDKQEKAQFDSLIKEARASLQQRSSYERFASPGTFSAEDQRVKNSCGRQGDNPDPDDGRSKMGLGSREIRSGRILENLNSQDWEQVSPDEDDVAKHAQIRKSSFSRERDAASPPQGNLLNEAQKLKNIPGGSHEKSLWLSERFRDEPKDAYFYRDDSDTLKAAALFAALSSTHKEISRGGSKSLQSGPARVENRCVTSRAVHSDDNDDEPYIESRKVILLSKSDVRIVSQSPDFRKSQSPEMKVPRKRPASPLLFPVSKERRVFSEKGSYSDLQAFLMRSLEENAPEICQALGLDVDSYYKSPLLQTLLGGLNDSGLSTAERTESPVMSDCFNRDSVRKSPDRKTLRSPDERTSRSPGRRLSRSPERQKLRSPDRQMSWSSGRRTSKSPDRQKSRSPDRRLSMSPNRRKSISPGRHTSRSPDRRRSKSLDRRRSRSPDRRRSKSLDRRRSRSPDRKISRSSDIRRSPDRRRSRSTDRRKSRSTNRLRSRSTDRLRSRSRDRRRSRSTDRRRSRSIDRRRSRSTDRRRSRSTDRRRSRSTDRRRSRSPDRRRSRSPDRRRSRSLERHKSRSPARLKARSPPRARPSSPCRRRSRSPGRLPSRVWSPDRRKKYEKQRFPAREWRRSPTNQTAASKRQLSAHQKEDENRGTNSKMSSPSNKIKQPAKANVSKMSGEDQKELPAAQSKELSEEQKKKGPLKEQQKGPLKEQPKVQELPKVPEKKSEKEEEQQQDGDPSKIAMKKDTKSTFDMLGELPVDERKIILIKRPDPQVSSAPHFLANQEKVYYEYYDSGNHWCRHCSSHFSSLEQLLEHSHTEKHRSIIEMHKKPWKSAEEKQLKRKVGISRCRQIKGAEMMFPLQGFYCSLCKEFFGDMQDSSNHLKNDRHYDQYMEFVKKNPLYEKTLLLEKIGVQIKKKPVSWIYPERSLPLEEGHKDSDYKTEGGQQSKVKASRKNLKVKDTGADSDSENGTKDNIEVVDMDLDNEETPAKEDVVKVPKLTKPLAVVPSWTPLISEIPRPAEVEMKKTKEDDNNPLDEFLTIGQDSTQLDQVHFPDLVETEFDFLDIPMPEELSPLLDIPMPEESSSPPEDLETPTEPILTYTVKSQQQVREEEKKSFDDEKGLMGIDVDDEVEKPMSAVLIIPPSVAQTPLSDADKVNDGKNFNKLGETVQAVSHCGQKVKMDKSVQTASKQLISTDTEQTDVHKASGHEMASDQNNRSVTGQSDGEMNVKVIGLKEGSEKDKSGNSQATDSTQINVSDPAVDSETGKSATGQAGQTDLNVTGPKVESQGENVASPPADSQNNNSVTCSAVSVEKDRVVTDQTDDGEKCKSVTIVIEDSSEDEKDDLSLSDNPMPAKRAKFSTPATASQEKAKVAPKATISTSKAATVSTPVAAKVSTPAAKPSTPAAKPSTPAAAKLSTPAAAKVSTPAAAKLSTPAAAKLSTPAAAKVSTPAAAKVSTPAAAKVSTPSTVKVSTPAAKLATQAAVKVSTPAAKPTPAAAKRSTPAAAKRSTPAAAKVSTPSAAKGSSPAAAKVSTSTAAKVSPTSVKVSTPAVAKTSTPTVESCDKVTVSAPTATTVSTPTTASQEEIIVSGTVDLDTGKTPDSEKDKNVTGQADVNEKDKNVTVDIEKDIVTSQEAEIEKDQNISGEADFKNVKIVTDQTVDNEKDKNVTGQAVDIKEQNVTGQAVDIDKDQNVSRQAVNEKDKNVTDQAGKMVVNITGQADTQMDVTGQTDKQMYVTGQTDIQMDVTGQIDTQIDVTGQAGKQIDVTGQAGKQIDVTGQAGKQIVTGQKETQVGVTDPTVASEKGKSATDQAINQTKDKVVDQVDDSQKVISPDQTDDNQKATSPDQTDDNQKAISPAQADDGGEVKQPGQMTKDMVEVMGATKSLSTRTLPISKVSVDSRFVKGTISAAVMVDPCYDILLGSKYVYLGEPSTPMRASAQPTHNSKRPHSNQLPNVRDTPQRGNTNNKETKRHSLEVGNKVMLRSSQTEETEWQGPFPIMEKVSRTKYKLFVRGKMKIYHVKLLRKNFDRAKEPPVHLANLQVLETPGVQAPEQTKHRGRKKKKANKLYSKY